jgi:hypothetical protein
MGGGTAEPRRDPEPGRLYCRRVLGGLRPSRHDVLHDVAARRKERHVRRELEDDVERPAERRERRARTRHVDEPLAEDRRFAGDGHTALDHGDAGEAVRAAVTDGRRR